MPYLPISDGRGNLIHPDCLAVALARLSFPNDAAKLDRYTSDHTSDAIVDQIDVYGERPTAVF